MRSTRIPGLLLMVCACGPTAGGSEESTGGEGETGTTVEASTSTSTATPTEGTEAGSSETSETTVGDVCEAFVDIEPSPGVTITLRNATAGPVFLFHVNFCEEAPIVEMLGPDSDVPVAWTRAMCEFTCGQAIDGGCGCPAFCAEDTVLMIAAGGRYSSPWRGAVYAPVQLPVACNHDGSCGDTCLQVNQAPAGKYTLRARGAATVANCLDPEMCTCTPNADGWCDVRASSIGAEPRNAEATLTYPGTAVELVFQ